ncbi:MAG: hypothetical protein WAM72_24460 [Xanthobacteraceae bacterium]
METPFSKLARAGLKGRCIGAKGTKLNTTHRRFPPPWSVDDPETKLGSPSATSLATFTAIRRASSYPLSDGPGVAPLSATEIAQKLRNEFDLADG